MTIAQKDVIGMVQAHPKYIVSDALSHIRAARDEGEPSLAGCGSNETRVPTLGVGSNPLGNGGEARLDTPRIPWDEPLDLKAVKTRFEATTSARLKPKSQYQYWGHFQAFADDVNLARYSKKDLSGKKGRELLLSHCPHVSARSRRHAMAAIKKIWRKAL